MKKSTAALASLITAAGLAGGAAATVQAHPAQMHEQTATHQSSRVALTRLHELLQTPSTEIGRGISRPNGSGSPGH